MYLLYALTPYLIVYGGFFLGLKTDPQIKVMQFVTTISKKINKKKSHLPRWLELKMPTYTVVWISKYCILGTLAFLDTTLQYVCGIPCVSVKQWDVMQRLFWWNTSKHYLLYNKCLVQRNIWYTLIIFGYSIFRNILRLYSGYRLSTKCHPEMYVFEFKCMLFNIN